MLTVFACPFQSGIPWNKNLTKETDIRVARQGAKGLGHPHSDESKRKIGEKNKISLLGNQNDKKHH